MRRLVYSPKVNAYVRTDSGIIDISDFIVRGSVNRVVNEVSTAEIEIRNPGKRFTKPGDPTFRPMDAITIFLSRFENRPVQTFTGYLDGTPYLQLFPGTVTLRASCTLKRLLHTYWDPGLYFSNQWLVKHGWLPDPKTGQVLRTPKSTSPPDNWLPTAQQVVDYLNKQKGNQQYKLGDITADDRKKYKDAVWRSLSGPDNPNQTLQDARGEMTDSGFGELMRAALIDIGNWNKDEILIEKIPESMVNTSVAFLEKVLDQSEPLGQDTEGKVKEFIQRMIGPYGGGASSSSTTGVGMGSGNAPPPKSQITPVQLGRCMLTVGFPATVPKLAQGMSIVHVESGFGDNPADWVPNSANCIGYWQIQLSSHPYSAACCCDPICSTRAAREISNNGSDWSAWYNFEAGAATEAQNWQPWVGHAEEALRQGKYDLTPGAPQKGPNSPPAGNPAKNHPSENK